MQRRSSATPPRRRSWCRDRFPLQSGADVAGFAGDRLDHWRLPSSGRTPPTTCVRGGMAATHPSCENALILRRGSGQHDLRRRHDGPARRHAAAAGAEPGARTSTTPNNDVSAGSACPSRTLGPTALAASPSTACSSPAPERDAAATPPASSWRPQRQVAVPTEHTEVALPPLRSHATHVPSISVSSTTTRHSFRPPGPRPGRSIPPPVLDGLHQLRPYIHTREESRQGWSKPGP